MAICGLAANGQGTVLTKGPERVPETKERHVDYPVSHFKCDLTLNEIYKPPLKAILGDLLG
jgi:hypothetical protein